jgi:hypothetical protein
MFAIDFKPRFYSYPLTSEEFARIVSRQKEIMGQLQKLHKELDLTPTAGMYTQKI